jgi:hypothetical protein
VENPKRGELTINLGSKSYKCKLNMDVLMRIEQNLGGSLLKLANKMQDADISGFQIVSILTPVIRSSGADVKDADVKKIVWDAGVTSSITAVAQIIAFIVGGDEEEVGNEEAGERA